MQRINESLYKTRKQDKKMKINNQICKINLEKRFWKKSNLKNHIEIKNEFSNISGSDEKLNKSKIKIDTKSILVETDCVGGVPLFYCKIKNKYFLSDNAMFLLNKLKSFDLDSQAYDEVYRLKHTLGDKTLHKKIKSIESGTTLQIDEKGLSKKRNILFKTKSEENFDYEKDFFKILNDVFDETIKTSRGNIVIPLSGGWDSRLLAVMIKEKSPDKKIITYTYGAQYNSEVKTSEKVAKKLGFEWFFVKYEPNFIKKIIKSEEFRQAILYNFNLSMTPHMRDHFAIKYLLDNKIIKKEDTVIPGHSLDFLAGSRIDNLKNKSKRSVIFEFLTFNSIRNPNKFIKKETNTIYKKIQKNNQDLEMFETIDFLERQPKFIINSLRVYDFFKLNWKIPFWDVRLVKFWNRVPNNLRKNQYLYLKFCKQLFSKYNVDFDRGRGVKGNNKIIQFVYNMLTPNLRKHISYFLRFKTNFLDLEKKSSFMPLDRKKIFKGTKFENKKTSSTHGIFVDMALKEIEENHINK